MGRRKKAYAPKSFESAGAQNDSFLMIYESMLTSAAFKDMTKNQRLLYVCMKAQYYGKRKPAKDYPGIEKMQGQELFYFNRTLAVEKYNLYSDSNRKSFYDDIKAIERHGFIKTISSGKATKSRTVYQFTSDWRTWRDTS